ncbi:MAG: TIM barrel protein, partial [Pseudomonadota bacterium]
MIRLSANLGFLWSELSLPEAIHAAKAAGFDAVECHWPFDTPVGDVGAALKETGLPMLGLNTRRGDTAKGENGLAALPGREADARAAIDEAIAYAAAIDAGAVHVMAGFAAGSDADRTFRDNLAYAAETASAHGIDILV